MNDSQARLRPIVLALSALSQTGCWMMFDTREEGRFDPPPSAQPPNKPPSIESIDIADWPPIGPSGRVGVQASDDSSVTTIEFRFAETVTRAVSGSFVTASAEGRELGEGFGELVVRALDRNGGFAERRATNLLVDLSPPIVEVGRTVIPATGDGAELQLWVADAWILGSVEVEFEGRNLFHQFEAGFPSTLGKDWDQSLVYFPASDLAAGIGTATVRVSDAAGNVVATSFTLDVDAVPPDVTFLSPAPGTHVIGSFDVRVDAADAGGGPVWVELFAGGAPLARVSGSSVITLDAAELAEGPLDLRAVAYDEAGNQSSTTLALVVDRP